MPARLRLLGAKGRAEGVDLSERGGGRLAVELPGLREIGVAFVEVLRGEQPAPLADRRGEDRRIDAQEAALVEEVVDRLLDLVADDGDGALSRRAQPEVPVVEQEIDAVLLRLDRIVERARADDREVSHADLEPARRARLGTRFASNLDGRLRGQLGEARPDVARPGPSRTPSGRPRAVAQHGEGDLAGGAQMRDPTADDDRSCLHALTARQFERREQRTWCGGRASGAAPAPRLESRTGSAA